MREVAAAVQPGTRVLVVDDSVDTVESTARLLKLHGHEVQTACDASEAITAALRWRPEFVLLDLGLPDRDGYQVALRIRRLCPVPTSQSGMVRSLPQVARVLPSGENATEEISSRCPWSVSLPARQSRQR